jgi:hypothetical protein
MKLALVIPGRRAFFGPKSPIPIYLGSSYKFGEALRQLCDVEVLEDDEPDLASRVKSCDGAVVKGDRDTAYRLATSLGKPYMLIWHDVASMRDATGGHEESERAMAAGAASVVFISEPTHVFCEWHYKLPRHDVIALRPLERDLDFVPLPKLPGKTLVYVGGIMEASKASTPWGYRCIHQALAAALSAGWQVHVYPSLPRPKATYELQHLGCSVHTAVPEAVLPRELSQYTAGLQAFNEAGVPKAALGYARLAWPNKTWLYLSAGIPTIGTNPGFESPRIYGGKWGVCLSSLDDFDGLDPAALPLITEELRHSQTIEHDLETLRGLLPC